MPARPPNRRLLPTLAAVAPALAAPAVPGVLLLVAAPAAHAAPTTTSQLSYPLGPCGGPGSACPDPFLGLNNGPFAGRDAAVGIFDGGSFTALNSAAEAEGKVVVLGGFAVDRSVAGVFNVGVAGAG